MAENGEERGAGAGDREEKQKKSELLAWERKAGAGDGEEEVKL